MSKKKVRLTIFCLSDRVPRFAEFCVVVPLKCFFRLPKIHSSGGDAVCFCPVPKIYACKLFFASECHEHRDHHHHHHFNYIASRHQQALSLGTFSCHMEEIFLSFFRLVQVTTSQIKSVQDVYSQFALVPKTMTPVLGHLSICFSPSHLWECCAIICSHQDDTFRARHCHGFCLSLTKQAAWHQ